MGKARSPIVEQLVPYAEQSNPPSTRNVKRCPPPQARTQLATHAKTVIVRGGSLQHRQPLDRAQPVKPTKHGGDMIRLLFCAPLISSPNLIVVVVLVAFFFIS